MRCPLNDLRRGIVGTGGRLGVRLVCGQITARGNRREATRRCEQQWTGSSSSSVSVCCPLVTDERETCAVNPKHGSAIKTSMMYGIMESVNLAVPVFFCTSRLQQSEFRRKDNRVNGDFKNWALLICRIERSCISTEFQSPATLVAINGPVQLGKSHERFRTRCRRRSCS